MDLATFQGIGQGINQGVAHGLNVGMRLREQESLDRHRQVLEEQTKAQTAVTNLHAEELRKKEEDYNSVVDITKTPMFLSLPDNVKPDALKFFSDNGYTDAVGKGTKGNIAKGAATISSTDELLKKFMAPKVEEAGKKVLEAWDKYELAKQSGDPEKVKKAYAEYRNFYTDYTTKSNGLDNQVQLIEQHNRKLEEEENKKEEGLLVVGHDVLDKKTRKRVYRAPFAPSNATIPKITANVALNPVNGQNEYLMTDGSFSGKVAAAKPKSASGADISRLQKAVNDAGDEPTPADQIAINEEAQRLGYTYENIQETKPGTLWGTNTTSTWRLVPQKQPQATSTPQTTSAYKTADDVKAAFKSGKIKEAEAVKILTTQFDGFE